MKDYVDQQKRLHNDIINGLLHNRELHRKQEEEGFRKEQQETHVSEESVQEVIDNSVPEIIPTVEEDVMKQKVLVNEEESKKDEVPVKDQLNLPLHSSRTQCLESPAFIPASAMPFVVPPSKLELGTISESQQSATADRELQVPLSPLCSHGESLRSEADSIKLNIAEQINVDLSTLNVSDEGSEFSCSDNIPTNDSVREALKCDKNIPSTSPTVGICVDNVTLSCVEQSSDEEVSTKLISRHSSLSANGIQVEFTNAVNIVANKGSSSISG